MTKRKDVLAAIARYARDNDLPLTVKEGGRHTRIWVGDRYTTVPRHNEIANRLAAQIFKQIGMP
ncbi:toxin HicA [Corynebacterium bovis]|uniref:Toxin HicA n=1 Tax=Corynebacterium bovis TaxID=36808 RepID=A0A3R8VST5_9CORY|nr:toxin HicA [Corynebacterium bovis]MDN8578328.1 toxin HicA [Corynebacterium bovis]RRO85705.1 toxin HicA [Corynebacterium bovis]RRQ06189.1 toxin HicA [Corynebacterium bovis]RRQ09195.1 toxin HicA [Corynebacterium bovis]RRQ14096.1 toxin HicA [Corynebacterium bovis]